jgi:hypothetical protein
LGIFRYRREDTDEDEATRQARTARVRAQQIAQWYADKMTLLGLSFPVYAAEGWPRADQRKRLTRGGSHVVEDRARPAAPGLRLRAS